MFSNYGRGVEAGEADFGGAGGPEKFFEGVVFEPGKEAREAEEQVGGGGRERGGVWRMFGEEIGGAF